MAEDGQTILMPQIEWGHYLVGYLFEVGPTMVAGMGGGPLTFAEIQYWQSGVGIELAPWEVLLLRRLSSEYLAESYAATKRDCPPPCPGAAAGWKKKTAREVDREMDRFLA